MQLSQGIYKRALSLQRKVGYINRSNNNPEVKAQLFDQCRQAYESLKSQGLTALPVKPRQPSASLLTTGSLEQRRKLLKAKAMARRILGPVSPLPLP